LDKPEPKQEQKKEPEPQIVPEPTLKSGEPQPGREPILKTEEDKMQVEEELLGAFTELVGRTKYREKGAVSVDDKGRANVLYGQVAGLYKSLAGENFFGKVNDQARQELQAKGYKIMTRKEYLSQSHEDALRQKMQKEGWAEGVKAIWDQLSPEDKAKGSIESFASELENDRKDLAGRGFVFSKDVYYGLFKAGYDPRTVEEKGFLKDIFKKNTRIEIERLDEKKETFTLDQFEAKRQALQQDFNQNVDKQVSDRLAKGYAEGRDRWVKTRLKKAGDDVLDVTKEYQNKEVGEGAAKFFEKKVRPENITPEQEMKLEEEEAEKTYHDRFNVLMNIMKIRVVDRLGLTDKQEEALRAHIDSGKKLPKNFLYLKV